MSYGVSARERKLLDELSRRDLLVFNPIEASNILDESRENTYRILSRMESKDLIHRIEKGKYIPTKKLEETHIYHIASNIVTPSYVSLFSALHHYGYITQVPRTVYVMITTPKGSISLQDQDIKFVKTSHFFGYTSEKKLVIAEPEKLFIDCLLYPEYAGGIKKIKSSIIEAAIDGDKIVDYALKINKKSLCSRLGYLLQRTDKNFDEERLEENISRSPIPLDPSRSEGTKDDRWNVIDNLR
ncbi:MAG: type IV toxin-antitoxin system AbiEi family antitoxin [Candidatus Thermoplasmatota archaeon]